MQAGTEHLFDGVARGPHGHRAQGSGKAARRVGRDRERPPFAQGVRPFFLVVADRHLVAGGDSGHAGGHVGFLEPIQLAGRLGGEILDRSPREVRKRTVGRMGLLQSARHRGGQLAPEPFEGSRKPLVDPGQQRFTCGGQPGPAQRGASVLVERAEKPNGADVAGDLAGHGQELVGDRIDGGIVFAVGVDAVFARETADGGQQARVLARRRLGKAGSFPRRAQFRQDADPEGGKERFAGDG